MRRLGLSCSNGDFASTRARSTHLSTTIRGFATRAGTLVSRLSTGTNRGGTRVLRKRLTVLTSPFVVKRVGSTVSNNMVTRRTISGIYGVFRVVFSSTRSRLAHRETASIDSVGAKLLGVLLNIRRVSVTGIRGNDVLITYSFAPDVASGVGPGGIRNIVNRVNKMASRDTVVTQTLNVPYVLNIGSTTDVVGSNSRLITSTIGNRVVVSPSTSRGTRCSLLGRRRRGRELVLGRCVGGPAMAGDNLGGTICTGVTGTRSIRNTIIGNTRKVNLFEARFLCVSEGRTPNRSRRFRTCDSITGTVNNERMVVHALSMNKSGRVSCLRVRGRRGPFVKLHTVECYLGGARLFGIRLHTLLHTTYCNGVGVVLPLIYARSRIVGTGSLLRRYGTRLSTRNGRCGGSVGLNVVIRAPTTILITRELTTISSFFDVNAGSLANCAVTTSENGGRISCLCGSGSPTILGTVRVAIGDTGETGVPIKVYNRTTTSPGVVPHLVS